MTEQRDRKEKQVLVISQRFPPESMAGAHRWEKLLENLPPRFNSHVLCPHPSVPVGEFERKWTPWERDRIGETPVTRLWTYQPIEDRTNIERILNHVIFAFLASLYVIINARKYDCVVVQIGPHTTLVPGLIAKALRLQLVVDSFDLWLENAVDLGFVDEQSTVHTVVKWIERIALERSDHIIVLTPTIGQVYQDKYSINEEKWTAIPFGVDPTLFDPSLEVEEKDRIVYTGKLGEGQAFKPFIRAFSELETDHELVIYGFGERREELQVLCEQLEIEDRVSLHDPVPREEIPYIVASSMISLVPLKTEYTLDYARPTKLLESMAVGTPYIASNVTEIKVITQESKAGIAVENQTQVIVDAFRDLLSDREKRQEMGTQGIEFINENHRWESLGDAAGAVLSTVVDNPSQDD